jgi:hypothetical protein
MGAAAICCRMSGEALSRSQFVPSRLTASEDWVRARKPDAPALTAAQLRQLQFH